MNIARVVNSLKTRGLKGSLERVKNGPDKVDIIGFYWWITNINKIPFSKEDYLKHKDGPVTLNWIIPEMSKGSGGHINIFRFVSYLERKGIHNRIYLFKAANFISNEGLRDFTHKYFKILDERVELYYDVKYIEFAHGTVATGWDTAYYVNQFDNTISKFYFVQDFEPHFYAHGSEYEFAENTYRFGLRGLTAGDWLKDICRNDYNMKADSFGFSYDKALYSPRDKKDDVNRIFFYARPVTPRRDFELGLLALNELTKKMPDVEVVFAGWDISMYNIPFKYKALGVLDISELADVYSNCDMCFVISNTNLSLLPLEVMASGSVAVCSKGANSEWLVNESNSILVDYDPIKIADTLEYYLKNKDELAKIRQAGIDFAMQTSWDVEGEKVYQSIMKGIEEDEKDIDHRG